MFKTPIKKILSLPFLPIIAAPFLLFILPLIRGETLFWGLPVLQFIPWRAFAWQLMSHGTLPMWNPYNGMGAPLLANYQLALFYPPGWLIYLANMVGGVAANAWMQTLLIPIHLAFCGAGMAMVGKRLGLTPLAQTIMGLSFSLSGYFVSRAEFYSMIWAGAWLPWIIYFTSSFSLPVRGALTTKRVIVPGLVISITMLLLAGHAQLAWYALILAGIWVIIGGWVNEGWLGGMRSFGVYILNGLFAAGLASIQLLPTTEYLLQSQRSSAVDSELGLTYSFWPWRFITLFAPDFFGNPSTSNYWGYASFWEDALYLGITPLFLAISSLRTLFQKKSSDPFLPLVHLCWVLIIIASILAAGSNTPIFPLLYQYIPTFSLFNAPARWMLWTVFCLSLLAGLGASVWTRPIGTAMRRYKRLIVASLAITIGAIATWVGLRTVQITFIEATVMLGIWATGVCALTIILPRETDSKAYRRWVKLAVAWTVMDLVWAGWGGQPFIPASYFSTPAELSQQETSGRSYLNDKDEYELKFHRFFRFSDYLAIEDWGNLKSAGLPNFNLLSDPPVAFVNNFDPMIPGRYTKWMEIVNKLDSDRQQPYLKLMNVTFRVERDVTLPIVAISKSPDPGSRVWWIPCAEWVQDEENSLQAVQNTIVRRITTSANFLILEGSFNNEQKDCDSNSDWKTDLVLDQPNQINIAVDSVRDGYLFLGDTWFPGWTAAIDGQPTELFHANYLFRAVAVKAGKHTVLFQYSPKSIYVGAGISVGLFSFMIIWMLFLKYRVKSSKIINLRNRS